MTHETENHRHPFWGEKPVGKSLWVASRVVFGILAAAVFALVFGVLVMLLWNWLMPLIFRLPVITYWQAFGIVILAKLILGSLGVDGKHRHGGRRFHRDWGQPSGLSPDEESECGPEHPGMDRWRHYRSFWKKEGKEAFEDYLKRMEGEEKSGEKGPKTGTSRKGKARKE